MKCRDCNHTMKHHKQRGRCRKGCNCTAALLKAIKKEHAK